MTSTRRAPLAAVAWVVLTLSSLLPRVILQEVFGVVVPMTLSALATIGLLVVALLATTLWRTTRPLVPLYVVLVAVVGTEWLFFAVIDGLPFYREWLADDRFDVWMLAEQSLKLLVALVVVGVLLIVHRRPAGFFVSWGDPSAPMRRIPWLGVKDGTRWSRFGPLATLAISAGTLAFLLLAGTPSADLVVRALPFLPVVLVAAAVNALYEEITWKASFLSVLVDPVGRGQALVMVAAFFGLNHYYGVPYGIVGVVLAFALGWLLGRSMLETRGLVWAWLIHFCQDVLIFSFLAVGSIIPGG
jgi:membrane protease YdiL (CAAX protease family)